MIYQIMEPRLDHGFPAHEMYVFQLGYVQQFLFEPLPGGFMGRPILRRKVDQSPLSILAGYAAGC